MASGPLLYLAAAPTEPTQVPTLTQPEGVRQLLETPPYSRYDGFNLLTLDRASLVAGQSLRVSNGDRKHIDVFSDGTFFAVGMFDEFLGWGRQDFLADPRVNAVAVIEFTYDFVLVYEKIINEHLDPVPRNVRFELGLRDAVFADGGGGGRPVYLPAGPIRDFDFGHDHREAPDSDFTTTLEVEVGDQSPRLPVGTVAYDLVRPLYNWFGHTDNAIPYTAPQGNTIDIQQIKDLR